MDQRYRTGKKSPETIRQTPERQPWSSFRREFLTMLGGVATVGVAGCSEMTEYEFEADPVILTEKGRDMIGVSEATRNTNTVTRTEEAAGVEAEVSITNHLVAYTRGERYNSMGKGYWIYSPIGQFTHTVNGTPGPGSAVLLSADDIGIDTKSLLGESDAEEPAPSLMKQFDSASPKLGSNGSEGVILLVPAGCRENGVIQSGRLLALIPEELFAEGKIRENGPEGPFWSIPSEDFFPSRTGWSKAEAQNEIDTTGGIQEKHKSWIEVLGTLGAGRVDHGEFVITGTPSAYGVTPEDMPGEKHDTAATLPTGDEGSSPIFAVPYPVEATPLAGMEAGKVFNYGADTQTVPAPLRGATFGIIILSTPAAEVGGQSLNPLGKMDFKTLLREVANYGEMELTYTELDWISGPTEVSIDAPPMQILGNETELKSFRGIVGDKNPQWNVGVHMARVEAEDDIVILVGMHRCPIAREERTSQQEELPGILRTRIQSGAAAMLPASEETKAVDWSATTTKNGSPGEPIKWWCPGDFNDYFTKYNINVAPGQSGTDVMAIESQTDLKNVEVWIAPEIDPYISFEADTTFAELEAGERNRITGKVDIPSDEKVGTTYDGTVEIKSIENNTTYPKVLEISIEVVEEESDQLMGGGDPQWERVA